MSGWETVLGRLPGGNPAPLPPAWVSRRRFDDPAARFCESLAAAKGHGEVAGSPAAALLRAAEILKEIGAVRVVANDEPPLAGLVPGPGSGWTLQRPASDPAGWRAACAAAGAGVTSADAALAETGSIVLSSGPGRSRLASLLPPVHIALVPLARLETDLFSWLAARGGDWPANLVLVSGPSKTADIEQTLSVGVHGPARLYVILYPEGPA